MDQDLCARVADIRRRLDAAALARWGRAPEIIAVSKTVSAPRINEVKAAGIARLGENRVQETLEKLPYLDAAFQIDLIGRLQINKVKYIIDKVAMIQSLDREPLAQEIDRRAQQHGLRMPVLIQVNIGNEPQKGGVAVEDLLSFTQYAAKLPGLDCGTCGAPTCRALAEDIVRGSATLHDCVFAMRDELAGTDMQEYIPAPFRSTGKKEETK